MTNQAPEHAPESWTFPRIWAALVLLLIAVTGPLWFPGRIGGSLYPMIPLLDLGRSMSLIVSATLVGSLFAAATLPTRRRWPWWLVGGGLFVSFLIDQHRLQPWAYQSAIYAVVIAALPIVRARTCLIAVAASMYIYSALGKFDYQFVYTVGQDFLNTLTAPVGGLPGHWDLQQRAKVALLFPTGEILVGIGLLLPWARRAAAIAAMGMHGVLLAILGPWGLDHSTGVLVWNVALLVQAYLLMFNRAAPDWSSSAELAKRTAPIAYALIALVLLAPLGERSGYWDHWTSWALYSPHSSRAQIQIHQSAIDRLPEPIQEFVGTNEDRWHDLRIEDWSLSAREVPVYPQARYQLALASELAKRYQLADAIRVRLRSVADRWTGNREEQRLIGESEIQRAKRYFWMSR